MFKLPILRSLPLLIGYAPRSSILQHYGHPILLMIALWLCVYLGGDYGIISLRASTDDANPTINFSPWGMLPLLLTLTTISLFVYLYWNDSSHDDIGRFNPLLTANLLIEIQILKLLLAYGLSALIILRYIELSNAAFSGIFIIAELIAVGTLLRANFYNNILFTKKALITYAVIVFLSQQLLPRYLSFWYQEPEDYVPSKASTYYTDDFFRWQDSQLSAQLNQLEKGQPGRIDLYFVGFGSDAKQGVFKQEVTYAQTLFAEQYNTQQRSIALINHDDTLATQPIATAHHLEKTLKHMGSLMDDEDILFLYLTSHGSRKHEFSISYPPFNLESITPETLKNMLDASTIKNRIVVVSACYSGGFIVPLQSDTTIVATAADATHTSFGCADHRDFTYFGEALFTHNIRHGKPFLQAFKDAADTIKAREIKEGITASNPQIWVGKIIKKHLTNFEKQPE